MMDFNFNKIIFLLLASLLISCNKDEDIDPQNTADLSIAISTNSDAPHIGTSLTFMLTATNNGPLDASDVKVINEIVSGYTVVDVNASTGEYDEQTGIWSIGNLENDATATLTLELIVNASGEYTNKASVSGAQHDLSTNNNTVSISLKPIALTNDLLFTHEIAENPNDGVVITGLSPLWDKLSGENKYNIVIPSTIQGKNVTRIESYSFEDKSELLSITLPASIKSIGSGAFRACEGLTEFIIPVNVTSIDTYLFADCSGLTSIIFSGNVTKIGSDAFKDCTNLKQIVLPETVIEIGSYAFGNCSDLTSINIPKGTNKIGYGAFYNCSSLVNIDIPEKITIIESQTFYACKSLQAVIIPSSVQTIGSYAFLGCNSLNSIAIPASVTKIGEEAFIYCNALTSFTVEESNKNFSALDGVLYNKDRTTLYYCPNARAGSFSIPNSVTSVGHAAFAYCKNLTNIVIPNTVKKISSNAFRFCTGITSFTIPDSVDAIGYYALSDNSGLASVTINSTVPPALNTSLLPFNNCQNLATIKVPAASLEVYKEAAGWSGYKNIIIAQ